LPATSVSALDYKDGTQTAAQHAPIKYEDVVKVMKKGEQFQVCTFT
jgi:hypothetical protein